MVSRWQTAQRSRKLAQTVDIGVVDLWGNPIVMSKQEVSGEILLMRRL